MRINAINKGYSRPLLTNTEIFMQNNHKNNQDQNDD